MSISAYRSTWNFSKRQNWYNEQYLIGHNAEDSSKFRKY